MIVPGEEPLHNMSPALRLMFTVFDCPARDMATHNTLPGQVETAGKMSVNVLTPGVSTR